MTIFNRKLAGGTERDLEQLIEPLASYICASDQPKAALKVALTMLLNEVEQTNRLANARVATFSENLTVFGHCRGGWPGLESSEAPATRDRIGMARPGLPKTPAPATHNLIEV